jgi:hypothetical protein
MQRGQQAHPPQQVGRPGEASHRPRAEGAAQAPARAAVAPAPAADSANVLYYPVPNVFLGPEIQWGKRENFRDGFTSDDVRVQFSVKYSFKHQLGGK